MNKIIKIITLATLVTMGSLTSFVLSDAAYAQNPIQAACDASTSASALCEDTEGNDVNTVIETIVNVLLFVVGLVSVIMIIVGGLRVALSGGNSASVTAGKNTILYAVVGLVAAFLSYAIINWVLNLF